MKKVVVFVLVIFLLSCISALRINEVEINPVDGKEWIELYNDDTNEINVTNWVIYDGLSKPSKIYTFSNETKINGGEFYIVETNRKLNNDGDFVSLYDGLGNKIDETPTLKEISPDTKTWQFCDGKWKFASATKSGKNNCVKEKVSDDSENEELPEIEKEGIELEEMEISSYESEEKNLSPIVLNSKNSDSKDIKSEESSKGLKRNLAIGGIATFCVVFGALFFLKTRRRKNEFQ